MRYVLPIPTALRGLLLHRCRLYAFPTPPEPPPNDGFVILDSGAFGLHMRGKAMNDTYYAQLHMFYQSYATHQTYCIAPDVFLDWQRSIHQWRMWHQRGYHPIIPVIQCPAMKTIDAFSVLQQCTAYGKHAVVAFSNPGLRGAEAHQLPLRQILSLIRTTMGAHHIHILGAGWDRSDLQHWKTLGGFDSMDSIAYYTAAETHQLWDGVLQRPDWTQIALDHAALTAQIVEGGVQ